MLTDPLTVLWLQRTGLLFFFNFFIPCGAKLLVASCSQRRIAEECLKQDRAWKLKRRRSQQHIAGEVLPDLLTLPPQGPTAAAVWTLCNCFHEALYVHQLELSPDMMHAGSSRGQDVEPESLEALKSISDTR